MSALGEQIAFSIKRIEEVLDTAKSQKYIKIVALILISATSVFAANKGMQNAQIAKLEPRIMTTGLTIFYTVISAMLLCGNSSERKRMIIHPKSAKTIMLIEASQRLYVIPGAIFFLMLNYGLIKESFGNGIRFIICAIFGVFLTSLTTILVNMSIKLIAVKKSKQNYGVTSHNTIETLCKTSICILTIIMIALSLLLCRTDSSISRLTAALSSPFGATIPISGWASSIVNSLISGNFSAMIPALILNATFVVIAVLILLLFDVEDYELTSHEYMVERVKNNIITVNITPEIRKKTYKIFGKLKGRYFAELYRAVVLNINNLEVKTIKILLEVFAVIIFATMIRSSGSFALSAPTWSTVLAIAVYIEIFNKIDGYNDREHGYTDRYSMMASVSVRIPSAMIRSMCGILPAMLILSATFEWTFVAVVCRIVVSIFIDTIHILLPKKSIISSHIAECVFSAILYNLV